MNLRIFFKIYNREYFKFFLRSLFRKSSPFYSLIFQVTNACNSRCITCFNWKILNKDLAQELTLEEIDKFTKKIGNLHTVTFGGGEPFLRKDLPEIVGCFNRNNNLKVAAIPTNCLTPDKISEMTEKILNNFRGSLKIGLSLDGLGSDHDKIRGIEGNFDKFLETYAKLAELKKQYPRQLRLRICTTIFASREDETLNIGKMPEFLTYIREKLPEIDSIGFELLRGDYNREKVRELSAEKFEPFVKVLERDAGGAGSFYERVIAPFYYQLCLETLRKKRQVISCRIAAFSPVVDASGNVYSCESRLDRLGNLRDFEYDLPRLWQSKKAREVRKSIRHEECWCTHAAYQVPNIFLSPKMIGKIILRKSNFLSKRR